MKRASWVLLALTLNVASVAQDDGQSDFTVSSRTAHESLWERVSWITNRLGESVAWTNTFVELATGLNFFDESTQQFQPSREEWEVYPDGIVARYGQHKVILGHNLADGVDVLLADGVTRLVATPVSLGFYDPVDGRQAVIAEVKPDCVAERSAAVNEIVFRNCFDRIRGSIRFFYTRAGLHQHVALEQNLELPEGFSDRSRLECYTVFAPDTPWPQITTRVLRREKDPVVRTQMVEPDFTDSTLSFGSMAMQAGTAFSLGDEGEANSIRVGKQFRMIGGQAVLIEAVEFKELESLLARLASVAQPETGLFAVNSSRQVKRVKEQARLPAEHFRAWDKANEIQLASNPLREPAVVIDYELLNSSTNVTLKGDTTYFVSASVNLSGTTRIEGGTVVKITNSTSAKVNVNGPIDCQTGPYRPAIFTSQYDSTVGESIGSGTLTNYPGALVINTTSNVLHDLRFSYATNAVTLNFSPGVIQLANVQFVKCQYPIDSTANDLNEIFVDNGLFYAAKYGVKGGRDLIVRARQVTVNGCDTFVWSPTGGDSYGYLTNCLLVAVTNLGHAFTFTTNSTSWFTTDPGGIFQTVGAGSHYLADGSTNRNAGTTNISADLLAALRKKTTYPPVLITTNFTGNTTLSPQAARDADLPDLGWHSDSLDFVVSGRTVSANLTLTNGVALGVYGTSSSYGLGLSSGNFVSEGTAPALNWIVRYNTVQEQSTTNWSASSAGSSVKMLSSSPTLRARFTGWSLPAGANDHFNDTTASTSLAAFTDCQFGGGKFTADAGSVALTNCLWERVLVALKDDAYDMQWFLFNNLFYGGTLSYRALADNPVLLAYDNLFEGTIIAKGVSSDSFTHDYNGYVTNQNRLTPNGAYDVVLTNNPVYLTSHLGRYYYPTSDGMLSLLLNAGSRNATNAGLYYFTTTSNEVRENNTTVDIGFHYAADLDGDGIVDYADTDDDGDGVPDDWEIQNGLNPEFNDATDDPDGDWLTNINEYNGGTNSTNPRDVMVVAWGDNAAGQCEVPEGLRNAVAVSGGLEFSLARTNGSVLAWGANTYGQTSLPVGLTNVAGVSSAFRQTAVAKSNGTVVTWGLASGSVPADLTNAVSVSAGIAHVLALRSNGQITAWGDNTYGECSVPASVTNAIAVAAGSEHSVALLANGTVTAWGLNAAVLGWNITNVPPGLSNVIAVAAGDYHTLALKSDGAVVAWGAGNSITGGYWADFEQSIVPTDLSNVIAIAASGFRSLALKSDGTIVGWGDNLFGQGTAPSGLSNVTAIAAGPFHSLAVRSGRLTPLVLEQPASQAKAAGSEVTLSAWAQGLAGVTYQWQFKDVNISGATNSTLLLTNLEASLVGPYTVVMSTGAGSITSQVASVTLTNSSTNTFGTITAWGSNTNGESVPPFGLQQVMALAAGSAHGLAVKDGSAVVGWGENSYGKATPPSGLSNLVAVAAGDNHSLALRENSTVLAWGRNTESQTNIPSGLTNVIAIAACGNQSMALRNNGTVTNWGSTFGVKPGDLTNAIAIAAGTNFCLALRTNGIVAAWGGNTSATNAPSGLSNVVAIAAGGAHALALKQDGTVTAWGLNTSDQTNVPAGLNNVMAVAAGRAHSVALKNDGTVVAWGDNTAGQTNVTAGLALVKSIAAGGSFSLAATFSPLVQYPVDVSKDLLLICNTNSNDSLWVKNYYLTNRPLVSAANVLGIACTNAEITTPSAFTNEIFQPYLNWLDQNPTKRPQYLIAFLDIPSRVHEGTNAYDSVFYQLHSKTPSHRPFVMTINMNGTNDCRAYIDKLGFFGTNYSAGKLVISASAGGLYSNTNYVVDNVRNFAYAGDGLTVSIATSGLVAAGVPTNSISYLDGVEICTQWVTNIVDDKTNISCAAVQALPHITNAVNVAGYISWGFHSSLGLAFSTNGTVVLSGSNSWYVIQTVESGNGQRNTDYGGFFHWFSPNAFGGTNHSHTPVGAVTHVDEPYIFGVNNSQVYFGLWASGKNFAICAWNSRRTERFQAVGDPFVRR